MEVIGRYALYDKIASGGMATVHLGRALGAAGFARMVAIKRLHANFASDPEFSAMFVDEARLCARIRHPNVVPTLDVVAQGDELFLVMEYVEGESLLHLLRAMKGERIPIDIAAAIMSNALHGLHAAHEATSELGEPLGIVHRDVSPANILVGVDGVARVLDFGVAKATGKLHTTREGQVKGKLAYLAPEQTRAQEGAATITRRADVFAASIVLWELLVGKRLFTGENEASTIHSVLTKEVPPPSTLSPDVPKALDAVVLRGLERDPARRYETALDLAIALEEVVTPANSRRVGEWVRSIAAERISTRAALVSEVERSAASGRLPEVSSSTSLPAAPSEPSLPTTSAPARSSKGILATALLAAVIGAGVVTAWTFSRPGRDAQPPVPAATATTSAPSAVALQSAVAPAAVTPPSASASAVAAAPVETAKPSATARATPKPHSSARPTGPATPSASASGSLYSRD